MREIMHLREDLKNPRFASAATPEGGEIAVVTPSSDDFKALIADARKKPEQETPHELLRIRMETLCVGRAATGKSRKGRGQGEERRLPTWRLSHLFAAL